ncbi:MAG TPA: lycopene cyclase domain-containing protein [Pirellulaceae bacterium]|jgi:hypothetical protein|nr:lycopene cyclase domain-containing protein [Pirellulaceae bacterium]
MGAEMPGVYFCGAAALTAIFALSWFAFPRRRPGALLSASALAPFGFLGYVFVPGYWEPDHLIQFVRGVGVEDFLICFSEGGLAWILAGYGARSTDEFQEDASASEPPPQRADAVSRYLFRMGTLCGAGGALATAGGFAGLNTMTAIVAGFTAVGIGVAILRKDLVEEALGAGTLFAGIHLSVGALVLALAPEAAGFWSAEVLQGSRTFGLPDEEFFWAVTFGACWPMFGALALGVARPPSVERATTDPLPEADRP